MKEAIQENITVIDGYYVDIETGEITGCIEVKQEFQVKDRASAEWVLEKILNAESDVASIAQTPVVIAARAILENAAVIEQEKQRRADWLRARFEAELGHWAKQALEEAGGKSKTIKTLYGSVSLRNVKGGLRVRDADIALEAAKMLKMDNAIKTTEAFQISALTPEQKESLIAVFADPGCDIPRVTSAFEIKPDSETVKIVTGVEE